MKSLIVRAALISLGLAVICAADGPCLLAWTESYCGPNQDAVDCVCFGASPPIEGACTGNYTTSVYGIWNPVGCSGGDCTTATVQNTICTRSYYCRRVDNFNHTHCLADSDCTHWLSVTHANKYTITWNLCTYKYKPI
ncbi:MAG: hypothetical protein ABIG44_08205 [Planctomycetota bacterium]